MEQLSLNQYLSVISSLYFLSDTQNVGGIPEHFFSDINEQLNISSPKGIRQWFKDNLRSKGFYNIPKIEEDVEDIVRKIIRLRKEYVPVETITIQCNKAIRNPNKEIRFNDNTTKKIDKRTLKELYSILTDEYIKPEHKLELQNYAAESYDNILKIVETNRLVMK
jgi:hypothetical protein